VPAVEKAIVSAVGNHIPVLRLPLAAIEGSAAVPAPKDAMVFTVSEESGDVVPIPTLPLASTTNGVASGFALSSTTSALPVPVWVMRRASEAELTETTTGRLEVLLM
jgi:hypothetical protein